MIPFFALGFTLIGIVFKAGMINQSIETMKGDVKDFRSQTGDIDKRLIALSENVAIKDRDIQRINNKMQEFINPPRNRRK